MTAPATAPRSTPAPDVAEFLSWVHGLLRMRGEHNVATGVLVDLAAGTDDQDRLQRVLARFEARQDAYEAEVSRRGETLGDSIQRLCRERALSLPELAGRIGCTPEQLMRYVRGTRDPSLFEITELCEELHVPVTELIGAFAQPKINNLAGEVAAFAHALS